MKKQQLALALAATLTLSGCATIMGDKTQLMNISSTPSAADVSITDETGAEVFRGSTPTNVTLEKSDGSYFGGKNYKVIITKEGYSTQTIPVQSSVNGLYVAGNFVFGGLIGWLVVDPFNGAMWKLSPKDISASLDNGNAHNNTASDGSIRVVLIEDVPDALLGKLQPL